MTHRQIRVTERGVHTCASHCTPAGTLCLRLVAVTCSVSQCVAVCRTYTYARGRACWDSTVVCVLHHVAVYSNACMGNTLQGAATHYFAVCCSVFHIHIHSGSGLLGLGGSVSVVACCLQCVSHLHRYVCVAACCSVSQCVFLRVRCSV